MKEIKKVREIEEDSYTNILYTMVNDGREIGWASVMVDSKSAYCDRIDIEEASRNHGFGTEMLRYLSNEFGGIVVAPDNEDAKRLYERLGYDVTDKEDWWTIDQGFGVFAI